MLVMYCADPVGQWFDVFYSLDIGATWKRAGSTYTLNVSFATVALGEDQFAVLANVGGTNGSVYIGFFGGL